MSIKIKKKTIIISCIVILAIILTIVGIIMVPFINASIEKTKLSKINAKEFESKIIEELKNTSLNINSSTGKTYFGTLNDYDNEASKTIKAWISLAKLKEDNYKSNYEDLERFIYAYILENNSDNYIIVPLFKIESDNNGNFKKIIYTFDSEMPLTNKTGNAFKKVLKEQYNIKCDSEYSNKYFNNYEGGLKAKSYYSDLDFMINMSQIVSREPKINKSIEQRSKELNTYYFGIDVQ